MEPDSSIPDERRPLKICSACESTVGRADCHRNRYGEYICHDCQARGVRFTWRRRLRQVWGQFRKARGRQVVWALIVAGSVSAALFWLFRLID